MNANQREAEINCLRASISQLREKIAEFQAQIRHKRERLNELEREERNVALEAELRKVVASLWEKGIRDHDKVCKNIPNARAVNASSLIRLILFELKSGGAAPPLTTRLDEMKLVFGKEGSRRLAVLGRDKGITTLGDLINKATERDVSKFSWGGRQIRAALAMWGISLKKG